MTLDGCTPFHGAASFLTAHAAFSLELEAALQSVEPSTACHYWDVSIDDHLYGARWASSSSSDPHHAGGAGSTRVGASNSAPSDAKGRSVAADVSAIRLISSSIASK